MQENIKILSCSIMQSLTYSEWLNFINIIDIIDMAYISIRRVPVGESYDAGHALP